MTLVGAYDSKRQPSEALCVPFACAWCALCMCALNPRPKNTTQFLSLARLPAVPVGVVVLGGLVPIQLLHPSCPKVVLIFGSVETPRGSLLFFLGGGLRLDPVHILWGGG